METLKFLIQRLKYPHKKSALKYFLRDPHLLFTLCPKVSKIYFSKTLESLSNKNIVECLHNFLPEKFYNFLMEKGFVDYDGTRLILYAIVRMFKPDIVVETGVARGASSAYILAALHENRKGILYSIDLPPHEAAYIKNEEGYILEDGQKHYIQKIGDLVPEYLRSRWTLIIGDSKKELPKLLSEIDSISIFFHDSLHTYEHMMFEYTTAWPHI